MTEHFKLAVCQYAVENLSFSRWQQKTTQLVQKAQQAGVKLLLLPEYVGLELVEASLRANVLQQFEALQNHLAGYLEHWQDLSSKYQLYIQPGSLPVFAHPQKFYNRAYLFSPKGCLGYQDKIHLTQFELNSKVIVPGQQLTVFKTDFATLAIAICYDSEFPRLVTSQTLAGAEVILVPSCTDAKAGYMRVQLSCRARALENQCYVANSCLLGDASAWCDFIDISEGQSGIYGPIETGISDEGIIIQSKVNKTHLLLSPELSLNTLQIARKTGSVRNYEDHAQALKQSYPVTRAP